MDTGNQITAAVDRPKVACERLGVSTATLYRLIKENQLQKIKIGARASGILGVSELIERRKREAGIYATNEA